VVQGGGELVIFDMTKRSGGGGEAYYINPKTGCIYPEILDHTCVGLTTSAEYGSHRWAFCEHLREATIRGLSRAGDSAGAAFLFDGCTNLQKINLPDLTATAGYVTGTCPALIAVQLGSIGKGVTAIDYHTFRYCNNANLTITIYVDDSTTIPFGSAPWGASSAATIIYRSSTTGEVRTV
jgi:hypothetical protein